MEVIKLLVNQEEQDLRLDRLIRRHYPVISQGVIEKSLRKNLIKLDNKKETASARVSAGQNVIIAKFIIDNMQAAPVKKTYTSTPDTLKKLEESIIHIDSDIIVLNKAPGLAVQNGTKVHHSVDTMLDHLKFGYEERPKLVHRIDKDTSGILLIARRTHIAAMLAEAFRNKTIEKYYWAIVAAKPLKPEGKISNPIRKKNTNAQEIDFQEAITYYKTIDYVHDSIAWLEMIPVTGRTHQLRIHAAKIGTPIIGDSKYCANTYLEGIKNKLHLHARKIIIKNFNGRDLEFTAPLPPHMKQTFKFFGLNQ